MQTIDCPIDQIIADPEELSRHDPEESRLLGLDMLTNGQLHPVLLTHELRLVCGHGRYAGALSAGMKTLVATIREALTETQFLLLRASENLKRKELTPIRRFRLVDAIRQQTGWSQKEIAEQMHLSEPSVSRILSVGKCIPELQKAVEAGSINEGDCQQAAKLSPDDQLAFLQAKAGGELPTREAARAALKGMRGSRSEPATPPEVSGRVKIPLAIVENKKLKAKGVVTVAGGKEISLADTETLLREALRAVREARGRGLGLKAAQSSWRDMAANPPEADTEVAGDGELSRNP